MNTVISKILDNRDFFAADAARSDELGRLTDETAAVMREVGVVKMMQPSRFHGLEAHPTDFVRAVHTLASISGSAGWVSGIGGLHPWEIAQMSESGLADVWGNDPDAWISSPYAPIGRAVPVDGGYRLTGRWPFASGTDHCTWAILGGIDTATNEYIHLLIPRADYAIVEDSWQVVGLSGTGSKDVVVEDAFVPEDRVISFVASRSHPSRPSVSHGNAAPEWENTAPLYRMPWATLFPAAITAATLGLCQGALETYVSAVCERPNPRLSASTLEVLGAASADIEMGAQVVFDDISRTFDTVSEFRSVAMAERIRIRRNQVYGVRRAINAVNALHGISGSLGIRESSAFASRWRDVNTAVAHVTNSATPFLQGYGNHLIGGELTEDLRLGTAPTIEKLIPSSVAV